VERKEEVEDKSIWLKYFHSIRHVCPWSYKSYLEGKIKIIPFDRELLKLTEMNWNLESNDALVYVVDDLTLNEIDEFVAHRNDCQEKCEYLWSHPSYTKGGNKQAPYPIIIQQDRAKLMELRYAKTMDSQTKAED
tara:strand:- start:1621 stop:2025 length:405 start_codon:yes stop_codon:yes gene_type:complete